ncbi:MAG: hypothetical protein AAF667_10490 [Pseudomonadota bacterium]
MTSVAYRDPGVAVWLGSATIALGLHAALIASGLGNIDLSLPSVGPQTEISFQTFGETSANTVEVSKAAIAKPASQATEATTAERAQAASGNAIQANDVAAAAPISAAEQASAAETASRLSEVEASQSAERNEAVTPLSTAQAPALNPTEPVSQAKAVAAEQNVAGRQDTFVAQSVPSAEEPSAAAPPRVAAVANAPARPTVQSARISGQTASAAPPSVTSGTARAQSSTNAPTSAGTVAARVGTATVGRVAGAPSTTGSVSGRVAASTAVTRAPGATGAPTVSGTSVTAAPATSNVGTMTGGTSERLAMAAPQAERLPSSGLVGTTGPIIEPVEIIQSVEEAQNIYEDVLDVMSSYNGGDCFAALPTISEQGQFKFETFARSEDDLVAFRDTVQDRAGSLPGTVMREIASPQCDALAFVQAAQQYPEFQIYFELEDRNIKSGEALKGTLGNLDRGFLSLLIIDDEGIVQDLGRFLRMQQGRAVFSVGMAVRGSPVETQQLLMAIQSPGPLATVDKHSGKKAQEFFLHLGQELFLSGGGEDIAVVAFTVR